MVISRIEEYLQNRIIEEIFCCNIVVKSNTEKKNINIHTQSIILDKDFLQKNDQESIKEVENLESYIDYSDLQSIKSENIIEYEDDIYEIDNLENVNSENVNSENVNSENVNSENKDTILLIISLGRSGSTTLCNLFNLIPNTNICGENYNAVLKLLQCYSKLKEIKKSIPTSNNYNTFSLKTMKCQIKNIVISMFKNKATTNLWGFKEVRWAEDFSMLNVFTELFPETKIIINVRDDIVKQSNSAFWKENSNALTDLSTQTEQINEYYLKNINRCFKISLEEFYDFNIMKNLFTFIGKDQYYDKEKILEYLIKIKKTYERQPYLHIHTFYPAKYKFIHVPKTGGSAVEQFIKPYSNTIIGFGHDNICKDNEYPVIIIRYPIERFLSMYYYWKYGSISGNFKRDPIWITKFRSFTIKDFICLFDNKSYKTLYNGFTWDQHFMPYNEWLDEESYSRTIVILYESDLEKKIYKLLDYINPPVIKRNRRLEKLNVSYKEDPVKLDNQDIEWINTKYKQDFELWNKIHIQPELFRKVI